MTLQPCILDEIVRLRKQDIAHEKQQQSQHTVKAQITASQRDFYGVLTAKKAANQPIFILECKKASPSKGRIRENFDVASIVQSYRPYATVISVLTEQRHFQGEFHYLTTAAHACNKPILCKDMIIDAYQIEKARRYGADAVLLMLSILSDAEYRAFAALAHELQMGVLTEVTNANEVVRAVALGAKVIGINNRNLQDLSIDITRTAQLSPLIPPSCIVISESGIVDNSALAELRPYADGFLIGSALMAQASLDLAVRKLLIGAHKVCGITTPKDAQAAYEAGAAFGGLIFVKTSPRAVSLNAAREIVQSTPLAFIGVFQNDAIATVVTTATELNLNAIQLHGSESVPYIQTLRRALPAKVRIIKTLAFPNDNTLPKVSCDLLALKAQGEISHFLLDSQSGGSGQPFNWALLTQTPFRELLKTSFLAGGINQHNLAQAQSLGAYGIDINSGAEIVPGKKEAAKLAALFKIISSMTVGAKQ